MFESLAHLSLLLNILIWRLVAGAVLHVARGFSPADSDPKGRVVIARSHDVIGATWRSPSVILTLNEVKGKNLITPPHREILRSPR